MILGNFRKPFYLAFLGATFFVAVFFVFGAVFLAVTFLEIFFDAGFDFLLAAFAAFSSLAANCLTRFSVSLISFFNFFSFASVLSRDGDF